MHNRSRHHFRTHNMVDSVKTDRRRRSQQLGGTQHKTNLKQLSTELLGTHCWASLKVRGDAIGLVSEQILLFHTTPTPTGCLLPCYWALQGLDGPGRSLCWTNPGSVNWRAARAGPILGAFIYRLVKARPIVWEFIGNCLDWSGGLDEGRTTSKNLFRRLINGWILPEIFYMKFFKQTILGGVKYVLKCWSDCKNGSF